MRTSKFGLTVFALATVVLAAPARPASVEEWLAPCAACHGANGTSLLPEIPSLGGQPEFYLSVQLLMFREKLRVSEPKNTVLKSVSDAELRRLAETLAKLPAPKPASEPADAARGERARALIAQHRCDFCHNRDFSGEKSAPRLAAQREDYLVKSLRDYKDNSRRAYDTSMADVMAPLTETDIQDLAHYLARF